MKNLIALICTLALTLSLAAECRSSHKLSSAPPPGHTVVPSAGVVRYTNGTGTGLRASYNATIRTGTSTSPGYLLTGGKAGEVGWNIPSATGGKFSVMGVIGAKISIASAKDFSSTVPFKIVLQSTDGVNHVCQGKAGGYHFISAAHGNPAYSTYESYAFRFTPVLDLGVSNVQKVAFVYTGSGTVGFTNGLVAGNNNIVPGNYSFITTPDTKFNYQ